MNPNYNKFQSQHEETLKNFISGPDDKIMSVFIQPNHENLQINLPAIDRRAGSPKKSASITPLSPAQIAQNDQAQQECKEFLTKLLDKDPLWIKSANSFVVTVTPEQLQAITESPAVAHISLNRELSLPKDQI